MRARLFFPFDSILFIGHNQLFLCSWVVAFGVLVSSFLLLESQIADWREPSFVFFGLATKASVLIGENQVLFLFGEVAICMLIKTNFALVLTNEAVFCLCPTWCRELSR